MTRLLPFSEKKFISYTDELCASFFIDNRESSNTLKRLEEKVEVFKKVALPDYGPETVHKVLSQIASATLQPNLNKKFSTLCLFASSDRAIHFYYDDVIAEKVVVDNSFFVSPVAMTLSGGDRHFILMANQNDFILYLSSLTHTSPLYFLKRSQSPQIQMQGLHGICEMLRDTKHPIVLGGLPAITQRPWVQKNLAFLQDENPQFRIWATIESSDFHHVADSSRDLIVKNNEYNLRNKLQERPENATNWVEDYYQIWHLLNHNQITQLFISSESKGPDVITRGNSIESLIKDDLVEEALRKKIKVFSYDNLKAETGKDYIAEPKIS